MQIVMIGSGHVATVLARKMMESGHQLKQVFSHTASNAKLLGDLCGCPSTSDPATIEQIEALYIIAIADNAIPAFAGSITFPRGIVVHTAGSVPKSVLIPVSKEYGVLYPLQSLRKDLKPLPELSLLVDGNNDATSAVLYDFAKTISGKVALAGDEERLKLHLAAVVVNNFSNHLYALTKQFCDAENVDFGLLLPLIRETAKRLDYMSPEALQTGPAIRNDIETIEKHLNLLANYPRLHEVYEMLTKSIVDFPKA